MGCRVAWKCFVACLFFDESQHPTCPHSRHIRRCTHRSPIWRHSSHPFVLGFTLWIWSRCVHAGIWATSYIDKMLSRRFRVRCDEARTTPDETFLFVSHFHPKRLCRVHEM